MPMSTQTRKNTARIKRTIATRQTVDALQPAEKPYIAWDDRLVGFGVRVLPSGTKSFILNYRPGGGRKAPNRRIVLGRCGIITPDQARRMAHEMLVRVAAGHDPAAERARARAMPTLREAFEEFLAAGPERKAGTIAVYRRNFHRHLGSLLERPLDTIAARDVEQCFSRLTAEAGWVPANNAIRMLRSLYLRRCIDIEGLHDPVDQWRATGGRPHRQRSRRIPPPAEVLPCWHRGIETAVRNHVARDAFRFGLYTGMRRDEVLGLRWAQVDMNAMTFRVEETGTGEPLELPVTRQAGAILERRLAERGRFSGQCRLWVFPSESSPSGRLHRMQHLNARIGEAGRRAVLVPRASHVLHRRGRARAGAARQPDRAAGQQRPAPGCDRGPCGGLDHGATARGRAAHRRPDRRTGRGLKPVGRRPRSPGVRLAE